MKKKKFKKGDKIEITWVDIINRSEWAAEEEIKEWIKEDPREMKSTGYFIMRYKGYLVFAMSKDKEYWGNYKRIPFGVIKKIRKV